MTSNPSITKKKKKKKEINNKNEKWYFFFPKTLIIEYTDKIPNMHSFYYGKI
jgi:hypothetical protein